MSIWRLRLDGPRSNSEHMFACCPWKFFSSLPAEFNCLASRPYPRFDPCNPVNLMDHFIFSDVEIDPEISHDKGVPGLQRGVMQRWSTLLVLQL